MRNQFTKNLQELIRKAIRSSCNMSAGENFKEYLPLSELIDYKMNQDEKLKVLICIPLMINEYVQKIYPFIDLSEITTDWTTEQIIYAASKILDKIETVKLDSEIPQYKDNTEAVQKIEDIIKKGFNVKYKKDYNKYLYEYENDPNYEKVISELKTLFDDDSAILKYYSIKSLQNKYKSNNLF